VLVLRFSRSEKQEQRLRTEMEAARRAQGQLVPADLPQFAAFACDAAYRAAGEVGGDFYQVFPRSDGSALILVGDVSGKGLRAAMLGTPSWAERTRWHRKTSAPLRCSAASTITCMDEPTVASPPAFALC